MCRPHRSCGRQVSWRGDPEQERRRGGTEPQKKKMIVTGLLVLLALTAVFAILLGENGTDLITSLSDVSPLGVVALLGLGGAYQALEALICRRMVRTRLPGFSFRQAWQVTHLKVFGDVASFGTASVPMQGYALYRKGLPVGTGIGMVTLEYVFHKGSILLYATVMLAFQWRWLEESAPEAAGYLLPAYGVVALIIAVLVLVCVCPAVRRAALWAVDRLPESGKWPARKEALRLQLDRLHTASRALFRDRACCISVLLLNAVKLSVLFSIPWLCMKLLRIAGPTWFQAQMFASVILLITSALPSVAGVGPTEFAFFLIFSPYTGEMTMVALALYRLATYYAPFLVSIYPFCTIMREESGHIR